MATEMKQGDAGERARATRAEEGKGNGAEVLGASALLDPYTWERPLDSVHRHSRVWDATSAKATSADRRTSRLPPGVTLFDPFGYGVSAEISPYDSALSYSTSPPLLSPSRSQASLSPYATSSSMSMTSLGSSMTTAGSLQPWNSDDKGGLGAPWEKRRSVSMGEVKGVSASRSSMGAGLRVAKLSKLSGEVDALSLSAALEPIDVVLAPGIVPADEDYVNSRLYQRTQKAKVALEKERRKSLAQDLSSASHRKSTLSLASTASTKRASMSWFRSKSEVAISTERIPVTPPLPSPASLPHRSAPRQRSLSDVANVPRRRQDSHGARGGALDGGSRGLDEGGRRQEDGRRRGEEGRRRLDVPASTSSSEPSSPHRPRLATAASVPLPPSPRRATPTPETTTDASSRHTPSPSPSRDKLGAVRVDERPKRAPSPLPTTMLLPLSSSIAVDPAIVQLITAPTTSSKTPRNPPSPSSSASSTNSPTTPDAPGPGPTLPPGAAAPAKGGVYRNNLATKSKTSLAGLFSRSTKDLGVRSSDFVVPPMPSTAGRQKKEKEKAGGGGLFSRARSFIGTPSPSPASTYRPSKAPSTPSTTPTPRPKSSKIKSSSSIPKTSFFGSFAPPPLPVVEKDLPRAPRLDGTR